MRLPSSALVPSRRTTRGTFSPTSFTAAITPSAIVSQRMMPPKMLTRMPWTFGSAVMILKAAVTFSFDARLAAKHNDDPLRATGTFRFSHYLNGEGAWAEADVDCLVTGGKVAVVSGVITDTDLPGAKGLRVGVTVHDQGRNDRLGYSWAATGSPVEDKDLAPCVSSAPFEKVKRGTGDFRVLPWQPEL